jgi:hypothetical protein
MPRLVLASLPALLCASIVLAADPTLVEKQVAVQGAMADARKYLDAHMPTEAVAALEKEVTSADGNKAFIALLREAYLADLYQLEKNPTTNPEKLAQTRRKLLLVGGTATKTAEAPTPPATLPEPDLGPTLVAPPAPPGEAPPPPPSSVAPTLPAPPTAAPVNVVADAVAAFKGGNFAEADRLFTALGAAKLAPDQKTAWAYCRIKLAADKVNAATCTPATAAAAAQSVADALELVGDNAKLLATGRDVLKIAQTKAARAGGGAAAPVVPAAATGDAVETSSFRVSCADREQADALAKAAEADRKQIFERWSGPPGGPWAQKCVIVIHPTAEAYSKATGKPAALTGHATITLAVGRVTARRIDLRADDPAMLTNALPRELTHVVLADLFADKPPPKWALEGMAVLAGSPEEISRYTRTLNRCVRDGEVRTLTALFDLKDFPPDKITGYYCQSVSVTEYLIKLNGERNFKIFLGDAQRYGTAQALKRQYGIESLPALEAAWKRACLDQARGQAP